MLEVKKVDQSQELASAGLFFFFFPLGIHLSHKRRAGFNKIYAERQVAYLT